jgi:two-component system sensor histidine kinase SenX3
VDALRVGVVVFDPEDQLTLFNPASRVLGLLRAGGDVGNPVPHPVIRTLASQVRKTGVRREIEVDLPRGGQAGNREPIGLHLRAVALRGGYVAIEAADVTEAHRVARIRRDFVANVSHELKTPVGALQLLAEALLTATDPAEHADPAAARRFAERIQHEASRLGRLVTDLLELSGLQGAEPLPQPAAVAVEQIVTEVLDRTRTAANAKDIDVQSVGARGLTVYGNEIQLITAVVNLVENAIAYSPDGTEVTIATRGDQEVVEISVIDQGIGIEAKDIDRIFERFYRSDTARSRATGGTGLGLAIVKHIATNHGGRVEVTSTPGSGATFTLRLPARPPSASWPSPGNDGLAAVAAEAQPSATSHGRQPELDGPAQSN